MSSTTFRNVIAEQPCLARCPLSAQDIYRHVDVRDNTVVVRSQHFRNESQRYMHDPKSRPALYSTSIPHLYMLYSYYILPSIEQANRGRNKAFVPFTRTRIYQYIFFGARTFLPLTTFKHGLNSSTPSPVYAWYELVKLGACLRACVSSMLFGRWLGVVAFSLYLVCSIRIDSRMISVSVIIYNTSCLST